MGERLLCKQEVVGSIPITSTRRASRAWSCRLSAVSYQPSERVADAERRLIDREKKVCPWV